MVAAAFIGPRPDGHEVRHLDGVYDHCVASNLAYGTRSENQRDSVRHGTNFRARKTHCPQGHEYTPENTYRPPSGGRQCRTCSREWLAAWKERNRAPDDVRQPAPAKRTHCPSGHPYTPENTYVCPDGARQCRTCRRAHNSKNRKRRRAKAVSPA